MAHRVGACASRAAASVTVVQPDTDGEGQECCPLLYPMWVMPLHTVLALTELRPHQELKAANQVLEFAVGAMVAIFVSHQWVAFDHPDPEMRQFCVLQDALRNIVAGRVKVRATVAHRFLGKSGLQLPEEQVEQLRAAHVWYDWLSCPQLSARSASQQVTAELQAAVDSIPAYVTLCNYFVVLVPSVPHHQLPETECDRASWSTRAWCRLEHFAWAFADGKPPSMLIRSAEMISFTTALQWLDNMPGSGVLTVEADRARIRQVVEGMAARKLRLLRRSGDLHGWRFLKALIGRLMSGLAQPAEHLSSDDFLSDFEFSDALASGLHGEGAGWTPLHYAAIAGEKVLGALVLSRCDPSARTHSSYPFGFMFAGSTPLLMAAALGSRASLRALLHLRADPSNACSQGFTALMCAARRRDNETEVLEDLVAARADVHVATAWPSSMTALHLAVMLGTPKTASALISLRADVAATSFVGNALTAACMYNFNCPDVVELLLRKRMDPNFRWDTWGSSRWVLGLAARAASLAVSSPFLEMVSISDGSTPLMFAARSGNLKAVRVLLAAKADPRARASNGGTAAAEAKARGLADILLLLEEAGSQPALEDRADGRWGLCAGVCHQSSEGGMAQAQLAPAVSALAARSGAEWDEVVERPRAVRSKASL